MGGECYKYSNIVDIKIDIDTYGRNNFPSHTLKINYNGNDRRLYTLYYNDIRPEYKEAYENVKRMSFQRNGLMNKARELILDYRLRCISKR